MEQITLNVEGMSCGHCVKAVEGSVTSLDGVNSAEVNLDNGTVRIDYDASKINVNKIKSEIEEQGYDVAN